MNIAKNTLNHVIYPRNTQTYNDARTSTWSQKSKCIKYNLKKRASLHMFLYNVLSRLRIMKRIRITLNLNDER